MAEQLFNNWQASEARSFANKLLQMTKILSNKVKYSFRLNFDILKYETKIRKLESEKKIIILENKSRPRQKQTQVKNKPLKQLKNNKKANSKSISIHDHSNKTTIKTIKEERKIYEETKELGNNINEESKISSCSDQKKYNKQESLKVPQKVCNEYILEEDSPRANIKFKTQREGAKSLMVNDNSDVFNRLHENAVKLQNKKVFLGKIKDINEIQYCTFKPYINKDDSNKYISMYERLIQKDLLTKTKYYEAKKAAHELEHCTFHPELMNDRPDNRKGSVYERLHNDFKNDKKAKFYRELAKDDKKEMEECTFSPSINDYKRNQDSSRKRFEELYQDNEKKKINLAKQEIEKEEQLIKDFKPNSKNTIATYKEITHKKYSQEDFKKQQRPHSYNQTLNKKLVKETYNNNEGIKNEFEQRNQINFTNRELHKSDLDSNNNKKYPSNRCDYYARSFNTQEGKKKRNKDLSNKVTAEEYHGTK